MKKAIKPETNDERHQKEDKLNLIRVPVEKEHWGAIVAREKLKSDDLSRSRRTKQALTVRGEDWSFEMIRDDGQKISGNIVAVCGDGFVVVQVKEIALL
jgi:hypothetical protein